MIDMFNVPSAVVAWCTSQEKPGDDSAEDTKILTVTWGKPA